MEENGKEECCIWSGMGDIAERQVDVTFLNVSEEESNNTLHLMSEILEDRLYPLPGKAVNVENTVKRMSSGEKSVDELTNLLRNHNMENNVKDKAEMVKEDVATVGKELHQTSPSAIIGNGKAEMMKEDVVAVGEELHQTCPSAITCNGNAAPTNNVETISIEKEDNITLKKEGGDDEPANDSVNPEFECASSLLKTNESNNHFINTDSSDLTKNAQLWSDEVDAQEMNDSFDIRFCVALDEFQETCKFCTKCTTNVNSESFSVTTKDLNSEMMETASTKEYSCSFCFSKSNKRKYCHDSKSEITEKNETDLMRPASRISDKSSNSNISGNSETKKRNKKEFVLETDPGVLSRRQKQIEYGKNTTGYQRYKTMVPKDQRTRQDPQTPPKCAKYSRRAWDGLIKTWRRKLHNWDPQKAEESDDEILSVVSTSSFRTNSDDSENLNDAAIDLPEEEQPFPVKREANGITNNKDADSLQAKET